jgi:hypothetical protein
MGSVDSMGRSRRVMGGPSSTTTYLLANPGAAAGTGFHGGPGGGYVTGAGADEIRTVSSHWIDDTGLNTRLLLLLLAVVYPRVLTQGSRLSSLLYRSL